MFYFHPSSLIPFYILLLVREGGNITAVHEKVSVPETIVPTSLA